MAVSVFGGTVDSGGERKPIRQSVIIIAIISRVDLRIWKKKMMKRRNALLLLHVFYLALFFLHLPLNHHHHHHRCHRHVITAIFLIFIFINRNERETKRKKNTYRSNRWRIVFITNASGLNAIKKKKKFQSINCHSLAAVDTKKKII